MKNEEYPEIDPGNFRDTLHPWEEKLKT